MNVGRRMSHPVITVLPNTPITKVHELMTREKIQQTPVVKNGKLVGIFPKRIFSRPIPPRLRLYPSGKSLPCLTKSPSKISWSRKS